LSNQGELGCEGLKIGPGPVTQRFFLFFFSRYYFPQKLSGFFGPRKTKLGYNFGFSFSFF
jgi:hypothetical protein